MSELFNEVDEDLRRDQLKKLWDRYSIFIIAGAILIVASVGGWRGYQYLEAKKAAEAGAAFSAAADLAEQNKHAEAEAAFAKLATTAPSGYRTLARLRQAAEIAVRDPNAAVKLYDEVAADRSVPVPDRDLAVIRAASLLMETTSYTDMLQRLEPATAPTGTYRHSARELLALSAWRSNDVAATRKWLELINTDAETPSSLRSRGDVLQALLPPAAKS
ncbi:MAG: tetratricopeptide repeat protein [Rhodopseudomonas sp.]|uniref:tetratricopeptide repeat protein n=1 Tax=Rhodopseudomonas sp. TaxID=1078 RepID=UPI00183575D7|nr:tetratricopeptide repeat protein [Rhodopseudomonas sp.]NVN86617.1 tetratricopeptide repeat protein [Rhodopseudomonas sp.]